MSHKYEVNAKFYGVSPSKATVREYRSHLGSRYFGSRADAVDYVNHLVDKLAASISADLDNAAEALIGSISADKE